MFFRFYSVIIAKFFLFRQGISPFGITDGICYLQRTSKTC
jgi:hypothetical protein